MSALTLYANAYVYINGVLLTQESSVSVEKKSGLNMVETTHLGLAGAVQGSARVEISIDNAVPSADFELGGNWDKYMITGEVVEIMILMGKSRISIHKVFVTDATYSHSVNDPSKISVKFTGRFANFEI